MLVAFALSTWGAGCAVNTVAEPRDVVFAVALSRHGVRSPTHAPAGEYLWPSWGATGPGELTAHGFALAGFMGTYELEYFRRAGLLDGCGARRLYAWADITDQRTMETGRGLLETLSNPSACGATVPLRHAAEKSDPLFHPLPKLGGSALEYSTASEVLRAWALGRSDDGTLDGIVSKHGADFAAFERLLDARCAAPPCASLVGRATTIEPKDRAALPHSLATLEGPVPIAGTLTEDLFLEYAQCRPLAALLGSDSEEGRSALLGAGMRLHALAYALDGRNAYTAMANGTNLLAHIVAMLDEKVGRPHAFADSPELDDTDVALLVGHDTNLAAVGGLLDATWSLDGAFQDDDLPPLGVLVFELLRGVSGDVEVRLRFLVELPAQLRSGKPLAERGASYPVHLGSCTSNDCTLTLDELEALVTSERQAPFLEKQWPAAGDTSPSYPPLSDPPWTQCD